MSEREEVARLTRRLERERAARKEAETIAERSTRELYDRQRELVLLENVSAIANAAQSTQQALRETLRAVCRHLEWPVGQAWVFDPARKLLCHAPATHLEDETRFAEFAAVSAARSFAPGAGLPGRIYGSGEPEVISDLSDDTNFPRARFATAAGLCAAVAFPIVLNGKTVAVLECLSKSRQTPTPQLLRVLSHVGEALARVFERVETATRLRHDATHDPLTGLANRTLFNDRVETALASARRHGTTLAVALLDLDRFKEVNDTLGHRHGDSLLEEVGARLAAPLRESDTIARLGGDEFGFVLPDIHGAADALAAMRRLRAALRAPLLLEGVAVQVDASVGLALHPLHGDDLQTLVRKADVGMYEAKRRHTGEVVYSPSIDPYSAERLGMVAALRQALERSELVLHYQPKVTVEDPGVVRGVEALVRWRDRERGLVSPAEFIPLAERTGLIVPLTTYVLREAIAQAGRWSREGLDVSIAVNVAARSLLDPDFPGEVAGLLGKAGVPPRLLEIEVTESSMLQDPDECRRRLGALSEMGISIAIDDFGTGYSSMGQLKQLPVQDLKIDRSFVAAMHDDERDAFIVRSTVNLGHDLGLRVVAEGVEDLDTLARLRTLGCDVVQGYLIQRPGTAEEIGAWLRARAANSERAAA
ncbi:MAG: putative bifunctional diguanylate cyclase/phosphodiesterase [Solirubrobacteraceae bacterium]